MINGVHVLIYSKKAAADKKFFRDVLKCPNVDVGGGWLIFGLPPSELAFHPSPDVISQEVYLMCDDIHQFVAVMKKHVSNADVFLVFISNLFFAKIIYERKIFIY